MKKLIAILLAVFVLSTAALAAGHGRGGGIRACDGTGSSYADANGDGVCDYYARERAVWAAPMWTLTETACATATAQAGAAEPTAGGPHSNSFQR